MLRFILPRIALRDLGPMTALAVCGALVSGTYGILHDQITYRISEEYFSKLKFDQFRWADIGRGNLLSLLLFLALIPRSMRSTQSRVTQKMADSPARLVGARDNSGFSPSGENRR